MKAIVAGLFLTVFFALGAYSSLSQDQSAAGGNQQAAPPSLAELIALNKRRERKPSGPPVANALPDLYPCDVPLESTSWQFLSPAERMLANGFEVLDGSGDPLNPPCLANPVRDIAEQIAQFYKYYGRAPSSGKSPLGEMNASPVEGDELTGFVQAGILMGTVNPSAENYDLLWKNPFTGAPIAWDKAEHSPGDCFIAIVNLHPQGAATVAKFRAKPEEKPATSGGGMGGGFISGPTKPAEQPAPVEIPANDPSNPIVMYVRIYGKTGVINSYVFAETGPIESESPAVPVEAPPAPPEPAPAG